MSSITVKPLKFEGKIKAPFSKSYLQRAIAVAVLTVKPTTIFGITKSKDYLAAIGIAKSLGAKISEGDNSITIYPPKKHELEQVLLNVGEAGLSTRMFAPIAASICSNVVINGEGSILNRSMNMVIDALNQLGCKIDTLNGKLPLKIKGKICPGEIIIDGSESSQLLTGLLIILPILKGDSVIHVKNLNSKPYVDMTLEVLSDFGISIKHQDYKTFYVKGNQMPECSNYCVEGDWSGASFFLVGGAISGSVEVKGLNPKSLQADQKILAALETAGANVEISKDRVFVQKKKLNGFEFDATQCPDLFPPLVVLGVASRGKTIIKGVSRLLNKESNRALTIKEEVNKLGGRIELSEDEMIIYNSTILGGEVSSRNDHRIAMMLAVLSSVSSKKIVIENPEAVNKSYPLFFEEINYFLLR